MNSLVTKELIIYNFTLTEIYHLHTILIFTRNSKNTLLYHLFFDHLFSHSSCLTLSFRSIYSPCPKHHSIYIIKSRIPHGVILEPKATITYTLTFSYLKLTICILELTQTNFTLDLCHKYSSEP